MNIEDVEFTLKYGNLRVKIEFWFSIGLITPKQKVRYYMLALIAVTNKLK